MADLTKDQHRDQIAADIEATLTEQVGLARELRIAKTEKFGTLNHFRTIRDIAEGIVEHVPPHHIPLLVGAAINRLAQIDNVAQFDEIADLDFEATDLDAPEEGSNDNPND